MNRRRRENREKATTLHHSLTNVSISDQLKQPDVVADGSAAPPPHEQPLRQQLHTSASIKYPSASSPDNGARRKKPQTSRFPKNKTFFHSMHGAPKVNAIDSLSSTVPSLPSHHASATPDASTSTSPPITPITPASQPSPPASASPAKKTFVFPLKKSAGPPLRAPATLVRSAPHATAPMFRLGHLPATSERSILPLTTSGETYRLALHASLTRLRPLPHLTSALAHYLPHVLLAASSLSSTTPSTPAVQWRSSMCAGATPVAGGVALELGFVLSLSALADMRTVFEAGPLGSFASREVAKTVLVASMKTLSAAAGKWQYMRETVVPQVMLHEQRIDDVRHVVPTELTERFCDAMRDVCLASAQLLSVRRARESNMSASVICKLCVECRKWSEAAVAALNDVRTVAGQSSSDKHKVELGDYIYLAKHISYLSSAWCYYFYTFTLDNEKDEVKLALKISALRHVRSTMNHLVDSDVARLNVVQQEQIPPSSDDVRATKQFIGENDLEIVSKALADLEQENRAVFQLSIPDLGRIVLPLGKTLVKATPFEPKSIMKEANLAHS